jgi:predicted nucleic-acid-binding Zn-ribbon protein
MDLVVIRAFDNYFNANILLTRLQADGMECYLKDENTVTIDPLLSNAIGGIKLVVKKKDAEEARHLLQAYDTGYMKAATCPQCGANNFNYQSKATVGNAVAAVFSILSMTYPVAAEYEYKCGNCGYACDRLPDL